MMILCESSLTDDIDEVVNRVFVLEGCPTANSYESPLSTNSTQ